MRARFVRAWATLESIVRDGTDLRRSN